MMQKTVGIVLFLTGLVTVLIPRYILPVCEYQGYKEMACSHTAIAEMFMGFLVMVSSAGILISKSSEALRLLTPATLASGASVLLIPHAIGYCHNSNMPCNYGTIPLLRLTGILIVIASLTGLLVSFRRVSR